MSFEEILERAINDPDFMAHWENLGLGDLFDSPNTVNWILVKTYESWTVTRNIN